MIWFGWVLWHINHCRLFNAKFYLYTYIKYIWFGLAGFNGVSTIIDYLMPNPLYTYVLNMICKHILLITFLKKPELIFYTQLNGFKYFYLTGIIPFTINHLFAHSEIVSKIAMQQQQFNISDLHISKWENILISFFFFFFFGNFIFKFHLNFIWFHFHLNLI